MEIEVKLELDEWTYREMLGRCRPLGEAVDQNNVFLDSSNRDLRRIGWTLRLRREADRSVLTVKGNTRRHPGGVYVREEFETRLPEDAAEQMSSGFRLSDCPYRPCRELLARSGDLDLTVTYEFSNRRTRLGFGRWELELDRTQIGDQTHFELELEIDEDIMGQATEDLKAWFTNEGWAFRPSVKSKLAKAEEWFCHSADEERQNPPSQAKER